MSSILNMEDISSQTVVDPINQLLSVDQAVENFQVEILKLLDGIISNNNENIGCDSHYICYLLEQLGFDFDADFVLLKPVIHDDKTEYIVELSDEGRVKILQILHFLKVQEILDSKFIDVNYKKTENAIQKYNTTVELLGFNNILLPIECSTTSDRKTLNRDMGQIDFDTIIDDVTEENIRVLNNQFDSIKQKCNSDEMSDARSKVINQKIGVIKNALTVSNFLSTLENIDSQLLIATIDEARKKIDFKGFPIKYILEEENEEFKLNKKKEEFAIELKKERRENFTQSIEAIKDLFVEKRKIIGVVCLSLAVGVGGISISSYVSDKREKEEQSLREEQKENLILRKKQQDELILQEKERQKDLANSQKGIISGNFGKILDDLYFKIDHENMSVSEIKDAINDGFGGEFFKLGLEIKKRMTYTTVEFKDRIVFKFHDHRNNEIYEHTIITDFSIFYNNMIIKIADQVININTIKVTVKDILINDSLSDYDIVVGNYGNILKVTVSRGGNVMSVMNDIDLGSAIKYNVLSRAKGRIITNYLGGQIKDADNYKFYMSTYLQAEINKIVGKDVFNVIIWYEGIAMKFKIVDAVKTPRILN